MGVSIAKVVPLGDQAALAYLADEEAALRFAEAVRCKAAPWLVDVVQAYQSVGVFFDLRQTGYEQVAERLEAIGRDAPERRADAGCLHVIPCCYAMERDLDAIAAHVGQSREEVIRLHSSREYTVYAIGFCPGFPYLGYLPPELCGVPRLATPRVRVDAGSVGLTGRQTGVYTEPRPGGWHIIGRTPLELVSVKDAYFPLRTGDRVHFEPIDNREYDRQRGRRLENPRRG
jgi:inhibitor of KinA